MGGREEAQAQAQQNIHGRHEQQTTAFPTKTHLEKATEKESKPLNENAVVISPVLKDGLEISLAGKDVPEPLNEAAKEALEESVVLRLKVAERANLREALKGIDSKHGLGEELVKEGCNEVRLEDEAEGDPSQEALKGLERHLEEGRALRVLEDELAQVVGRWRRTPR